MKKHKRLLVFQWKYTKRPMSHLECFGHAVKGNVIVVRLGLNINDACSIMNLDTIKLISRALESMRLSSYP